MKPIYTFAKWKVKENHLESILKLLPELIEKSAAEEGNLIYKAFQSASDTNVIVLFEAYANQESLEFHRNSAYFQQTVIKEIVPLLETREIVIASELDFADMGIL